MFDYDKLLKKISRFDEMPWKKVRKTLSGVFLKTEDDFQDWFFGNNTELPMTQPMVDAVIDSLVRPTSLIALRKYFKELENDAEVNRNALFLVYQILKRATEAINTETQEMNAKYKANEIDNKTMKDYKDKTDEYMGLINKVTGVMKKTMPGRFGLTDIVTESKVQSELVYSLMTKVPDVNYIKRYKIGQYVANVLDDIYTYTGKTGHPTINIYSDIKWAPLFENIFGKKNNAAVAINILLEGVKRVDKYSELEEFDEVRSIWDHLTLYALNTLNDCDENTRCQMIEIYIKKIGKYRSEGVKPRINLLDIPREFELFNTSLGKYYNKLASFFDKPLIENQNNNNQNRDNRNDYRNNGNNNNRYNDNRQNDRRDRNQNNNNQNRDNRNDYRNNGNNNNRYNDNRQNDRQINQEEYDKRDVIEEGTFEVSMPDVGNSFYDEE